MAKVRISQTTVSALQPGETLWDSAVRGFGVRKQRHTPVYVLKYRFKGRQRFVTIGPHGSPWAPETARQEAVRMLGLLASKERPRDPAAERDNSTIELTFAEMADRYLADFATSRKKARTFSEDTRNLQRHILPFLGRLKLSEIGRRDLVRFMSTHRQHPIAANRCLALISHVFTMAEKWELKEPGINPCKGVDRFKEKNRERLLDNAELAQLGHTLNGASTEGTAQTLDWRAIACIWLLIFTGARLNEILSLEWTFIKWDASYARLPDSKTGAKSIPLPGPALSLLKQIRDASSDNNHPSRYVLPGDRGNSHFCGIQKPWRRVRAQAGLHDLRLHDLRHCYASTAVASGESLYLVGTILGHRQATTTQRYAHLAIAPLIEVADRTANKLAAAMGPPSLSRTRLRQGF